MLTKEQERELWEWCGFIWFKDGNDIKWITYPNGEAYLNKPELTLDNLFKWAVPKLKSEWRNWESVLHDWVDELTGDYEKDAQSLAQAILKVTKKEV